VKNMENKVRKAVVGVTCGVIAGLFGSGGGIAIVEGLERAGTDEKRAHAASIAVMFPISAVSAILYGTGGYVPLDSTLWLCGGAIAGGLIGACLLRRVKTRLLNILFTVLMIASGVWMLL
jgi:uncharacterized membrane protein YfcA